MEVNRRAVLHSAAFAAGTAVIGATPKGSAASVAVEAPIAGRLVAWLRIQSEGRAAVSVVELDAASRPARVRQRQLRFERKRFGGAT